MGKNKALMASAVIERLTQLVEQHGDLPVMVGSGHTLTTPALPKVMRVVREEHMKTMFACHRQLLNDFSTIPVIHLD